MTTTSDTSAELADEQEITEAQQGVLDVYRRLNRAQRRRIARGASPELRMHLAAVERDMALKRSPGSMAAILTDDKEMQAGHLDLIDQVFRDIARGISRKVVITMPPRHGKSRRTARWAPLWFLARHPERRVMIASYSADLADDHGRWIRDAINGYGPQLGIALHAGSKAANRFDLAHPQTGDRLDGGLVTAGVGGGLTGKGAHLAIVDDPIKDDADAQSPTMRKRLWDWWTSVLLTRIEPGGSVIVIQCIVASMRILRGDGRWVPIVDMKPGDTVVSLDRDHKKLKTAKVIGQRLSGTDETLTVKTDRLALQVNPRHPFAVLRRGQLRPDATDIEWVPAGDLKTGDMVVTAKSLPDDYVGLDVLPDGSPVDEQRAWLLGYMAGDGWVTKHKRVNQQGQPYSFAVCCARTRSKKEHKHDTDARARAALEAWSPNRVYETSGGYWRTDWNAGGRLLHEMGYANGTRGKRVADCVWDWSPNLRRAYLKGYVEADGSLQYVAKKRDSAPVWRVGSVNQALLRDMRDLALTCGIRPTTVFVDRPRMQHPPNSPVPVESVLCSLGLSFGHEVEEGRSWLLGYRHPNAQQLRYERIRSVEPGPTVPVYDLAVDGTENFVAEGFVVHNTRWHEQDLAGKILAGEDASDWTILDLPAIADSSDDPLGRPIGDALWPLRYGTEALARIRRSVGERVWWSLYQQKPRPLEGGVWKWPWITENRISPMAFRGVDLSRIIVSVDHAGGEGDANDEVGLCVAGRSTDGDLYLVADKSDRMGADTWGHETCRAAIEYQADAIVVEDNFGGDMARQIIRQAWKELAEQGETKGMLMPSIIEVHAKKGKRLRAEPIAQLYAQGLVHHLGEFPRLESQMVTWVPGMDSPDRMDAAVHALTELADPAAAAVKSESYADNRLRGRR